MAITTLDLCFMNPATFKWNIKICKARAAEVRCVSPYRQSQPHFIITAYHALDELT